tara:strand:- start:5656 stop:6300 length:645 start_codon:yes stop_codon:yes gene_type:complete
MSSIQRLTPHSNIGTFDASNSFVNTTSQDLVVRVKSGAVAQVFTSIDGGTSWSQHSNIDASYDTEVSVISVGAEVTHINVVSSTNKKVIIKPMPQGLVGSWMIESKLSSVGSESLNAISASEKASVDNRIAAIESKSLAPRSTITLSGDAGRVPGAFFDAGASFANIRDKSFMIFVNGQVLHSDDYTVHDDNDGKMSFSFDLGDSPELNIFVWE